jgi:effector-binding domain-containing protein
MKLVKFALLAVTALLVLVVAAALVLPRSILVERSETIQAPASAVFPHIRYFELRQGWSPWRELDPAMRELIIGPDGITGTVYHWEGNEAVGSGDEEIVGVDENHRVDTVLRLRGPFTVEAESWLVLEPQGKVTRATWGYHGGIPPFLNVLAPFIDFDQAIGSDFEKGLRRLKELVEAEEARRTFRGYRIREVSRPEQVYLTIRKRLPIGEVNGFLAASFAGLAAMAQSEGEGVPTGLFFEWNEADQTADVAAAYPVAASFSASRPDALVTVPGGKALVVDCTGNAEASAEAHRALDDYMQAFGLTRVPPVVEEYLRIPEPGADPAETHIRIVYYVASP